MAGSSKYPDRYIKAFRDDYYRHGKYNLEVQAPHLASLADHYKRKYLKTKDWTDCLKAHSLYNAVAVRKPDEDLWRKKVFEMQQVYWGANSKVSLEEHLELSDSLIARIEDIRKICREKMTLADPQANMYHDEIIDEAVDTEFYESIKRISKNCTDMMICFAEQIIKESVKILTRKPPCEFQSVAIGSLAKGEATPYSDLEFLFLLEKENSLSEDYFELLAMTTYFVIGNIQETKLSYMAIEELQGWFDDQAKNGFKIDGLSPGAGNIPTGNGLNQKKNHFIITPEDLASMYEEVLNNPTKEALRGDLTAMLTYVKPFYSSQNGGKLLELYRERIGKLKPNEARQNMNTRMLFNDAEKFNFEPNAKFSDGGFNTNVKKELYRLPSILLLDISILERCALESSWETLDQLAQKQNPITPDIVKTIRFALAAAVYTRLSAYLYHDSHDDRVSVAPEVKSSGPRVAERNHACKSWFLPKGLFCALFSKLSLVKLHLVNTQCNLGLNALLQDPNHETLVKLWSYVKSQHYSGSHQKALLKVSQIGGGDPVNAVTNIPLGLSASGCGTLVADIMHKCGEYVMALRLFRFMTETMPSEVDDPLKIVVASVLCELGRYDEAFAALQSVTDQNNRSVLMTQGVYYEENGLYLEAEKKYVAALQVLFDKSSAVVMTDYYGNYYPSAASETKQQHLNLVNLSPKERLRVINSVEPSMPVILMLSDISDLYRNQGQLHLALSYAIKTLEFTEQLYAKEAASSATIRSHKRVGQLHADLYNYKQAEYHYTKAVNISYFLDLSHQAESYGDLAYFYLRHKKYTKAEKFLLHSLARFKNWRNNTAASDLLTLTSSLSRLGRCYAHMGNRYHYQAEECLCEALSMLQPPLNANRLLVRLQTIHWLSSCYKTHGNNGKAMKIGTEHLKLYPQCGQKIPSMDREMREILSPQLGPVATRGS